MKTAVSMPNETYHRLTGTARKLGLSRSELLTRAAVAYLDELDSETLTDEINRAVDLIGDSDDTRTVVVAASKARMAEIDDEW
jgi:predicted DNA-binding protein